MVKQDRIFIRVKMDKLKEPPIGSSLANNFLWLLRLWIHEVVNEILNILSIRAEDTAGAGTVTIDPKRSHTCDNIGIAQEIRTARVTKAGAACGMVV